VGKADERMLALWHALDATELGLTKQEIRRLVPGYGLDTSDLAFEKMFTRDKNALRDLGTALETYSVGSGPERYRLVANSGPVIDLTLAEAAAVRLAASIWAAGDLSADANKAADKVTGGGGLAASSPVLKPVNPTGIYRNGNRNSRMAANKAPHPQPPTPEELEALSAANDAALIAHVPASGALIRPLLAAISERRRVRFGYRSGVTGKVIPRLVEPWRVAFRDGGWYLLGRDADQIGLPGVDEDPVANMTGTERAFRLSRVVGEIKAVSAPNYFPAPQEVDVSELLGETSHTIAATLGVLPGRAARLRALAVPDDDQKYAEKLPEGYEMMKYRYDDEREFADELAGLGENVVVLGPPQLRAAVVNRLKAAAGLGQKLGGAANA
jgi:proteasome accessory factor B